MKKVFIIGAISDGIEIIQSFESLVDSGYTPILPETHNQQEENKLNVKLNIQLLLCCDYFYCSPNWIQSKRCRLEVAVALESGLEVVKSDC